jgi:ankyrin repeat protein
MAEQKDSAEMDLEVHEVRENSVAQSQAPLTSTPSKDVVTLLQDESERSISLSTSSQSVNITYNVHGSTFDGSTLNMGPTYQDKAPEQNSPGGPRSRKLHPLCRKFSKLCLKIAKCFNSNEQLQDLKVIVSGWSTGDVRDKFLSAASSAATAHDLISKANDKCLWHWLDYPNLVYLVEDMECEEAAKFLQEYNDELKSFCFEKLGVLVKMEESLRSCEHERLYDAFMEVKWEGDKANFKLGHLYKAKDFLVECLNIPHNAFVFYDICPGCITLRWVVLGVSYCKAIESKLAKCQFPMPFAGGEIQSIKLVYPVDHTTTVSYFYGNFEFKFNSQLPDHCLCPICFGITQSAVITKCCHVSFCSPCLIEAKKHSPFCPICREGGYTFEEVPYIDQRIIGNISGKCCKCKWKGDLFNALSHPCNSEQSEDKTPTEASQLSQATGTAEQLQTTELDDADCSRVIDDSVSIASDKDPILDHLQQLREDIRALHALLPSSHSQRPPSRDSVSENVGAFRDALDTVSALIEQVEERFHDYAASIPSDPDSKISDVEGDDKGILTAEESDVETKQPPIVTASTPVDIIPPTFPPEKVQDEPVPATLAGSQDIEESEPQVIAISEDQHMFNRTAQRMICATAAVGNDVLLEQLLTGTGVSPSEQDQYGRTPLHIAAQKGHAKTVQKLLAMGSSVTVADYECSTPLHEAVSSGSPQCLISILDKEPRVDAENRHGQTPLLVAAAAGKPLLVEKLLEKGASPNHTDWLSRTALHLSSKCGNITVVNLLLDAGAHPDTTNRKGVTPLHLAAAKGHTEIVSVLIKKKANLKSKAAKGMTPLLYAVANGHVETTRKLIELGADVAERDEGGRGLVHLAVKSKNIATVKAVVEMGCDVNDIAVMELPASTPPSRHHYFRMFYSRQQRMSKSDDLDSDEEDFEFSRGRRYAQMDYPITIGSTTREVDANLNESEKLLKGGCTPLQLAVVLGETEVTDFLLTKGANIHAKTKEAYGPLHMAVWNGNAELTQKLIDLGCDPNEKTGEGLAPLHLAVKRGHKDVAATLINSDCDMEVQTSSKPEGRQTLGHLTPFLIAAMEHKPDMIDLLVRHGCKVDAEAADGSNAFHLAVITKSRLPREPFYPAFYHDEITLQHKPSEELCSILHRLNVHGCDVNKVNSSGFTPLDLSEQSTRMVMQVYGYGHDSVSAMLMRFGAKTAREMRREEQLSRKLKTISDQSESIQTMVSLRKHGHWPIQGHRVAVAQDVKKKTPSMYELSSFVVPRVSSVWREIGAALEMPLDDTTEEVTGDKQECCLRVFKRWLQGEGKQPKTWKVVLDVLRDAGKHSLAESIMDQLHAHACIGLPRRQL